MKMPLSVLLVLLNMIPLILKALLIMSVKNLLLDLDFLILTLEEIQFLEMGALLLHMKI